MIAISITVLSFLAVTNIQGDDLKCNFPPSLWCSSQKIAERCQVTEQCMAWFDQGTQAPRVALTLYLESLCPDCQNFIQSQLAPTYGKISDTNVMVIGVANAVLYEKLERNAPNKPIPLVGHNPQPPDNQSGAPPTELTYKNQQKEGDKWVFTCQHGPDECLGNIIETCVTHLYKKSISIPFIFCVEQTAGHIIDKFSKCATQYKIDQAKVLNCVNSSQGDQWEHEAGVKTEQLDPPHQYVPWITLNGVHTDQIQKEAESNLLKLVCDTYTGEKPAACHAENTHGRCYKQERSFTVV